MAVQSLIKTKPNPAYDRAEYEFLLVDRHGKAVPVFHPLRFSEMDVHRVLSRMEAGQSVYDLAIKPFIPDEQV